MHDNPHVLVVDDDAEICALVADYLSSAGHRVSVAHDGDGLHRVIAQSAVDLVLLDLTLASEDGLALARVLRGKCPDIGIVIITGRGDTIDRIIGLEMGADDYLAKPFHLRELLARVKSVMRRRTGLLPAEPATADRAQIRFAGWLLDRTARELFSPTGERVRLTAGEFGLLSALVVHPNEVLSRDRLLDLARDRKAGPFDRTINVQIGRLRRKLYDDPKQPRLIKTLRGGGYMFVGTIEPAADRAPTPAA